MESIIGKLAWKKYSTVFLTTLVHPQNTEEVDAPYYDILFWPAIWHNQHRG